MAHKVLKDDPEIIYDLVGFKAPRVSGMLLVIVTWLTEWIAPLARFLGRDSGIFQLRNEEANELPTYYPFDEITFVEQMARNPKAMTVAEAIQILQKTAPDRFMKGSFNYHAVYLKGKVSPVDVVSKVLENTIEDQKDPEGIHGLIKFDEKDIMMQAKASEARYKTKTSLGPLDGVPIAIKDEMDALPYKTGVGTKFLDIEPTEDAVIVARLRQQGAIIIGKASMHEFGLDVTNCNPNTGTPRNAYNVKHWPGGSSGGSATLVAAGVCPISVGADGGGSIRIPAAYNGVYGLKVTAGRISGKGSYPLAPTVGVVGPIAINAHDLALSYMVVAGKVESDPKTFLQPPPTISTFGNVDSLSDLRLGVYWPYFNDAVS
jgi:Asp-tRNA(Asn)/Glu-tRNA(Gln) amidotransferase A subunit family amidase